MAGPEARQQASPLLGREAECAAIEWLLGAGRFLAG
jgi:hypothetical protein